MTLTKIGEMRAVGNDGEMRILYERLSGSEIATYRDFVKRTKLSRLAVVIVRYPVAAVSTCPASTAAEQLVEAAER